MAETLCVAPDQVARAWPLVAPWLRAATEKCGDWSIGEVRALLDRDGLLWLTAEGPRILAATVTCLTRNEKGLACQVIACGGDGVDWNEQLKTIEAYAKAEGCAVVRVAGRMGWTRVLNRYRATCVILEKDL